MNETFIFEEELEAPPAGVARTSATYVRWVQQSLNRVLGTRLAVDGIMGPATRSAVRTFQQRNGLLVDGIVGPQTEAALAGSTPAPPAPAGGSATSFVVRGASLMPPLPLRVTNFRDTRVARLRGTSRPGRAVTELIVHETVTRSVADTVAVLQQRGLSVHLIMGPDGALTQHGDLGDEVLWHASQHNGPSVGVEVVNPYYPRYLSSGMPWTRVIEAGWAHERRYVLPTPAQAEATAALIAWITSPAGHGFSVPRRWVGLRDDRLSMGPVPGAESLSPGVYAHAYFNHADGTWLVLYAWLRLEAGMAPATAYEEAVRLATTSATSIPLSALVVREAFVEPAGFAERLG